MHTITATHISTTGPFSSHPALDFSKGIQIAVLAGFISAAVLSTATAADFSGSLKGVSITDSLANNKAPIASFTYTQEGDIITLDAGGSSDPDGNIAKYKWTFGDGATSEGATATYTLTGTANLQVTLTVIDNNNGVALNQQSITPAPKGIHDDFNTNCVGDACTNYTSVGTKTITIADGLATGTKTYSGVNAVFHKTTLNNSNQFIYGRVAIGNNSNPAGFIFRGSGEKTTGTGYLALFTPTQVEVNSLVGNARGELFANRYGVTLTAGNYYLVRLEIIGTQLDIWIDINNDGDFLDANEHPTHNTKFSSAYNGNYVGIGFLHESGSNAYLDDFNGGNL